MQHVSGSLPIDGSWLYGKDDSSQPSTFSCVLYHSCIIFVFFFLFFVFTFPFHSSFVALSFFLPFVFSFFPSFFSFFVFFFLAVSSISLASEFLFLRITLFEGSGQKEHGRTTPQADLAMSLGERMGGSMEHQPSGLSVRYLLLHTAWDTVWEQASPLKPLIPKESIGDFPNQ